MNFFKSVFIDDDPDQDPATSNPEQSSNPTQTHQPTTSDDDDNENEDHNNNGLKPNSNPTTPSTSWSFGGLIKTFNVKSDWIDTYKRDLEEFGSGLKKETEVFREVASRAVKDLPNSIEISASKAQTSLESIGSTVWKSTADIVSQGKESLLAHDNDSYDASDINNGNGSNFNSSGSGSYSRFDAQLRAIQCDVNTYIEEPDDVNEYNEWKCGVNLEEKSEEIEGLMRENGTIYEIYKRVVPDSVDHGEFWFRYYYRVHRLKQADNFRAKLVKRAISTEDEEELSWDVDEEEEEEEVKKVGNVSNAAEKEDSEESKEKSSGDQDSDVKSSVPSVPADQKAEIEEKIEGKETSDVIESASKEVSNKDVQCDGTSKVNDDELKKSEEKVASDRKTEYSVKSEDKVASEGKSAPLPSESSKDSDLSVISTQPPPEEDDMGWDEIEHVGSEDEKKASDSGSPNRAELQKRLSSAADDDEDLSWDIEDDDEPVKA